MAAAPRHDGQQVARWFAPDYWRSLVPGCTISDDPSHAVLLPPLLLPEPQLEELRQRMTADGYFELGKEALAAAGAAYGGYAAVIQRLGAGVRQLVAKGWPASFIVVRF